MIITNHPELGISVKTLYNYIDQGVLFSRNIHLKRKVKFKPWTKRKTSMTNRTVFEGRTYRDFKEKHCDELDYVQMDTVLSAKGSSKCILTLYFPYMELLVGRLMDRCSQGSVKAEFDRIQKALGGSYEFSFVFPVVLTDRGSEFGDPEPLENDRGGTPRTSIYYCDPMRSCQKAGIEEVHTMLRMVIPKGTILEDFAQWDIRKAVDHINNASRKKTGRMHTL